MYPCYFFLPSFSYLLYQHVKFVHWVFGKKQAWIFCLFLDFMAKHDLSFQFIWIGSTRSPIVKVNLTIWLWHFQGQFNGSACGLQLSCLKRLKDVSSVEPNHTVLHEVVAVIEESDEQMFCMLTEIPKLDQAVRSVHSHFVSTVK